MQKSQLHSFYNYERFDTNYMNDVAVYLMKDSGGLQLRKKWTKIMKFLTVVFKLINHILSHIVNNRALIDVAIFMAPVSTGAVDIAVKFTR